MPLPVDCVQRAHAPHLWPMLMIVKHNWRKHNPSRIADGINARYGFIGRDRLDGRHVENLWHMLKRLDSDAEESRLKNS